MKRLFAFSSIITFLFTAFVFTSCSNIFEDKYNSGELVIQIPSEKSARAAADYDSYDFTISITNRDTKANQTKQGKPGQSCSFELEGGFYNIKISASDSSEPDTVLFEGEATDVEVIPGQTTEVPVITLKRLSRTWTIDLSDYIKYIQIKYNKWGGPNYESDNVDITNSFNGSLPKAGDTLNFTWKAKSDIDIDKIGMHIANIDFIGKGPGEWVKWTHLISPEKWDTVAASNIKAGQEFEINVSYVLDETPENNVKFTLWYSEEVGASAMLYTGEKPDLKPVEIKIEDGVIKFTKPGKENLEQLISKGCNGYIVGIVSGENEDGNPDWIWGNLVKFTDENAFKDIDVTLQLIVSSDKIKDNTIYPILDFYKNVSFYESEREFIEQHIGRDVEYEPDSEIVLPVLKLENQTIKITPPSEKFIQTIKACECTAYAIGIKKIINENHDSSWLFGRNVHLTDENVFSDVSFPLDFANHAVEIGENKVIPVLHFYKGNIDVGDEREFVCEIKGPEVSYTPDPDITAPVLELEYETVKITAPSEGYLDLLRQLGCNGYTLGILSDYSRDDEWIFGRDAVLFNDNNAFNDVDFGLDFSLYKSKVVDNKVKIEMNFCTNADLPHEQREYLLGIRTQKLTYSPDPTEYPLTLEGRRFGTELYYASVSGKTITWDAGVQEGHAGWNLSGIDLSKYDRVRVEIESNTAPRIKIAINDTEHENYHAFHNPIEENTLIWEADLTGEGSTYIDADGTTLDPSKGLIIFVDGYDDNVRTTESTTVVKSVEFISNVKVSSSLYNPSGNDIMIYDWKDNYKSTIKAGSASSEKVYPNTQYYFMDGTEKIYFESNGEGCNFYLNVEKPEAGKNYIFLNQSKQPVLDSDSYGKFNFLAYEIVDANDEFAYEYSEGVYIKTYPSANYWTSNNAFANSLIGTTMQYSDELLNEYTIESTGICWGWQTQKDGKYYNHIISKFNIED